MRKRQKLVINLAESYRFEGRARFYDAKNNQFDFVECELRLSPEEIRLVLTSSSTSLPWENMCELKGDFDIAHSYDGSFFAYNLRLSRWTSKDTINKAEYVAEVIVLGSESPSKWISEIRTRTDSDLMFIGDTKTQYRVLHKDVEESFPWNEVGVSVGDYGKFSISYRKHSSMSSTELIKKIVPYSNYIPNHEMHIEEALQFLHAYRSFLSVLKGSHINYTSVQVTCDGSNMFLYFPNSSYVQSEKFVFKLRRNTRFNDDDDAISDDVFSYFIVNYNITDEIDLWDILNMYVKATSFSDNEEKFLSLFRITEIFSNRYKEKYLLDDLLEEIKDDIHRIMSEKTTLKSRQIKRFKKSFSDANEMLNTGEQIKSMMREHKEFAEAINITDEVIDRISKIRNRISHATPYFISPDVFHGLLRKVEMICYYNILVCLGFETDYILKYIKVHGNFPIAYTPPQ